MPSALFATCYLHPNMVIKIKELTKAIKQSPYSSGIDKPEPLKYNLKGFGPRRISNG